ncbi:MAG: MBL fold metallo-hydrolase [Chloroflexota bacterium]|nr:MBL fold metallo-hydrolase [Chloroflexota bacterium]
MRITMIYENSTLDPELSPAWGFSCLVGEDLLFDTGGDSPRLLSNMEKMGIDAKGIKTLILSHAHGDHIGGLEGILSASEELTIYVPRSFPSSFKDQVRAHARLVEVHEPREITEGIYTTGEMGRAIREQSLVLSTEQGLVVITGCAHPGIVSIVEQAKEVVKGELYLVLGGFHLGSASRAQVADIIASFRRLGVQKAAPCHCTGERAIGMFAEEYGEDYIEIGVGKVLEI